MTTRRKFIASVGTVGTVAIAGCSGVTPTLSSPSTITDAGPRRPFAIDATDDGDHVVVVGKGDEPWLQVFDITSPESPTKVGQLFDNPNRASAYGLNIDNRQVYCAGLGLNEFYSVDLSNPTNPTLDATISGFGNPRKTCIDPNRDYCYMSTGNGGFHSIDISTPPSPSLVDTNTNLDGTSKIFEIGIVGDYAYVANRLNGSGELDIIDLSDPTNTVHKGTFTPDQNFSPYGIDAIPADNELVVSTADGNGNDTEDGVFTINVSSRTSPSVDDFFQSNDLYHNYGLDTYNNDDVVVLSARNSETITHVDISDYSSMSQIAVTDASGNLWPNGLGPYDSVVVGGYVFTVRRGSGELIVSSVR